MELSFRASWATSIAQGCTPSASTFIDSPSPSSTSPSTILLLTSHYAVLDLFGLFSFTLLSRNVVKSRKPRTQNRLGGRRICLILTPSIDLRLVTKHAVPLPMHFFFSCYILTVFAVRRSLEKSCPMGQRCLVLKVPLV